MTARMNDSAACLACFGPFRGSAHTPALDLPLGGPAVMLCGHCAAQVVTSDAAAARLLARVRRIASNGARRPGAFQAKARAESLFRAGR